MEKSLEEFTEFLSLNGCPAANLSEIKPDDKARYFTIQGDKKGQKRASYQLKITNEVAVGWLHDHRIGETFKFTSKEKKIWSQSEKKAFKKKIEEERLAQEKEEKKRHYEKAKEAKKIYSEAVDSLSHPYLKKKGFNEYPVKIYKNKIVLPLYSDSKLYNVQTISGNGEKLFLLGAKKKGCYYPLAEKEDDKSVIVITEGFSDALTIRMATGLVCLVAFDCGNLLSVSKHMREKYPKSKIIIACDNDQWRINQKYKSQISANYKDLPGNDILWKQWRDSGFLENIGLKKGKEAAYAVNGHNVPPPFKADDEKKRTDWNDYGQQFGLDEVKKFFNNVVSASAEGRVDGGVYPVDGLVNSQQDSSPPNFEQVPLDSYEQDIRQSYETEISRELIEAKGDWKELLIYGGRNGDELNKSSLKNKILFLAHHEKYSGIFKYNEFSSMIYVTRCPPWEDSDKFKVHYINDIDITNCAASLEDFGLSPDRTAIYNAITSAAHINRFHPGREYFNELKWDGVNRLEKWLTYYMGAEEDEHEYLAFIGKKWLTAAVKRVYEPGCKFDHVLVFEGMQGAGKSTTLKALATFGDKGSEESYFTDSITVVDIQNKDTIQKIQGSIIVELAELAGFSKKDDEEIKRWITLQHDDSRLPYDKTVTRFHRQFVLAATTNSYDYLKDPTGNRRYWPLIVGKIDLESLERDKSQLWAEAVYNYKKGLYLGPTEEEAKLAERAQNRRLMVDPWQDDVETAIDDLSMHEKLDGFKTEKIMKLMNMSLRDKGVRERRRITNILQQLGYESRTKRNDGRVERVWLRNG